MDFPDLATQLTRLQTAVEALATHATAAGPEADVPTCPSWDVRKLLAHQGMVHRWATANLRQEQSDPPALVAEGEQVGDPVAWLRHGANDLVRTLESVPDDVKAMVFLKDAPPPRLFWARRQVHETTIHAVDALAAELGRVPTADEVDWVDEQLALDGIDETLTGFVTRGRRHSALPRFSVAATGTDRVWNLAVGDDERVATTRASAPDAGGAVVSGPAPALYLALWNRGTADVDDPAGVMETWRETHRVRFS